MRSVSPLASPCTRSLSTDEAASEQLFILAYDELRRLAQQHLWHERPNHTLTPTALVHEAYLKMAPQTRATFEGKRHFIRVAAQAMRRILVNHARARTAQKRGGDRQPITLQPDHAIGSTDVDLVALDQALNHLGRFDARKRDLVELRYFAGLTADETADVLGISRSTVYREWTVTRAWLLSRLRPAA
jgi:RNA polymerase sigma factor (TIGR02999 family)